MKFNRFLVPNEHPERICLYLVRQLDDEPAKIRQIFTKGEFNSKHNDFYSSSSIIFDTTSPVRASCIKYNGGRTVKIVMFRVKFTFKTPVGQISLIWKSGWLSWQDFYGRGKKVVRFFSALTLSDWA